MSGDSDRSAWGDFWQLRRGDSGFPKEVLLRLEAVQRQSWEEFARSLSNGARVLDLGTGSGIVLAIMQRVRPDLDLVGVDSARALPSTPPSIVLKAGVTMEALPFQDASFAAVTSQFGYEYGDTAAIALEAGRVVAGGGHVRLLMHHAESPIVDYHRARHAALLWAVKESSCLEQARAIVSAGQTKTSNLQEILEQASQLYSGDTVAAEFVSAVLRTLTLGQRHPAKRVLEVLHVLEERADSELARLGSLIRAARDQQGMERIVVELREAGLETAAPETLAGAEGTAPFGWLVEAHRP